VTVSFGLVVALCVVVAGVAAGLTYSFGRPGAWLSVLDLPNERSLHQRPTPRTGGLAILAAVAGGWLALFALVGGSAEVCWIAGGALSIAVISFADDRGGVSARCRLLVHLLGAASLLAGGLAIQRVPVPGGGELGEVAGVVLTVGFVVWMTNLYNFMDGMDGFAGGMSVSGFGSLGVALWLHGDRPMGAASILVAAGALGFLRYNFPPARIFLGDIGAAPLGYLAAALALHGDRSGALPLWAACVVFSPFVVDATVTLVRRAVRGERVWQAHRTHYYQRLVTSGWSHRRTVLCEYVAMLTGGVVALHLRTCSPPSQWLALAALMVGYVLAMVAVNRFERIHLNR